MGLITIGQPVPPLLWYPYWHRLDIQFCIAADTAKGSKGKGTLCLLVQAVLKKPRSCMETVGYQIPHLQETLGCFPVVTIQLPSNASFQVWLSHRSPPGQLGKLLVHLAGPRSLNLLSAEHCPAPPPSGEVRKLSGLKGFFPLKDICITWRGKLIPGNVGEHLVLKALSEWRAKYWTDTACTWPSCSAYYYQLLLNKTRERPLEGSHTFSACSWRSCSILAPLWSLWSLENPNVQKLCIQYVHEL